MNYYVYVQHAQDEVIAQADNGLYYLEPSWRMMLTDADLEPSQVSDVQMNWDGVKEWLELQVKKLNTIEDKKPAVIDWLYETVTAVVEPAMLEEETEYLKNLTEYMKEKNKAEGEQDV